MNSHGKGVSSGVLQANARLRDALMILEGLEMPSNEKELKHRKPQERGQHETAIKAMLSSGSLAYKKNYQSWYIGAYMVLNKVNFWLPSCRSGR